MRAKYLILALLCALLGAEARGQGQNFPGSASGGSSSTTNAAPNMGFYLGNFCGVANTKQCFFTFADLQQAPGCSWTAATPSTVTCGNIVNPVTGSVAANVATYASNGIIGPTVIPATWKAGDNIVITGFTGGDIFFNQTCTAATVTGNTVTCPLVHGNAVSISLEGQLQDTNVGPFVAGDVGSQVAGWLSTTAFQGTGGAATTGNMGANAITVSGAPVIISFISQTQVKITTAANAQSTLTGTFIWGHPDDAGAAAVEAAYDLASQCPKLFFQSSYYSLTQPHWYTQPNSCTYSPIIYQGSAGNVFYSGGFELDGRGSGNTLLWLFPNFPNGDSCTRGFSLQSCFLLPVESAWKGFTITGGSQSTPNPFAGANFTLIEAAGVNTIQDFGCINYAANDNGTGHPLVKGIRLGWQVQLNQVFNSGCGGTGISINSGQGGVTARFLSVENSSNVDLSIDGTTIINPALNCYDCHFFGTEATAANVIDVLNIGASTALFYHSDFSGGSANATPAIGYDSIVAGGTAIFHDSTFRFGAASATTSIQCTAACTTILENTSLTAGATGKTYSDVAGSSLIDACGNTFTGGTLTAAGTVRGPCAIAGGNPYGTTTNCASGASPAVCGSATSGDVAVPAGATPTLQINTTAITAASQVQLSVTESTTVGTRLGVTCNTTLSTLVNPVETTRTAATSFTIQLNSTIAVNPACVHYTIIN